MGLPVKELDIPEKTVYTYEDYRILPEGAPYQLIGGELIMIPPPSTYHQIVSMELGVKLANFVKKNDLGIVLSAPIDVYFEETETYQPDITFISKDRLHIIERERIKGGPDLVIEILSPATAYYDLRKKFKIYEKHGVQEYWIVDPEDKSVIAYKGQQGKFSLIQKLKGEGKISSGVLKELEIELGDIF